MFPPPPEWNCHGKSDTHLHCRATCAWTCQYSICPRGFREELKSCAALAANLCRQAVSRNGRYKTRTNPIGAIENADFGNARHEIRHTKRRFSAFRPRPCFDRPPLARPSGRGTRGRCEDRPGTHPTTPEEGITMNALTPETLQTIAIVACAALSLACLVAAVLIVRHARYRRLCVRRLREVSPC